MTSLSEKVKQITFEIGADICGIAPIDRFKEAPNGFHPKDVYKKCKSVLVFAVKLPTESLFAENCIPYTQLLYSSFYVVDNISFKTARRLESLGIASVIIPCDDPYLHWEPERQYGQGILSLRHAGVLAGLGVLGKNTLLINKDYGNMITPGALLLDTELDPDPLATYTTNCTKCNRCIDSCPQKALDGQTVDQQKCRELSTFKTKKGHIVKKCFICRKNCPHVFGIKMNNRTT